MGEAIKILAQADLGTSLADIYTVPALTSVVISSIVIANRASVTRTFTLKAAPLGAADAAQHHVYAAVSIPKNNTFVSTIGMTLGAGDKLRGLADATGAVSITLFGTEYT